MFSCNSDFYLAAAHFGKSVSKGEAKGHKMKQILLIFKSLWKERVRYPEKIYVSTPMELKGMKS